MNPPLHRRLSRGPLPIGNRVFQCLAALAAGAVQWIHAEGINLGVPTAKGVDLGELLLGELNCVACHGTDRAIADRLTSRPAPLLGANGLQLEPQWLRGWLSAPSASKPGTTMPHLLHGLPEAERTRAVDELAHYLVSVQPMAEPVYTTADPAQLDLGRELYHSLGCVACHAPTQRPADLPQDTFERAQRDGLPLGNLASKFPGGELIRFLKDPVKHRPGGRMPSLGLSDAEARAVATYLLRDQAPGDPKAPSATVPGLKWEYFEAFNGNTSNMDDGRKPSESGETDQLEITMGKRQGPFGVRFTGAIEIATAGTYTFWLNSDDGSTLDIDGKRVVNNDGVHPPDEKQGKVQLTKGPHTLDLRFFQGGGGWEFKARWAGPGFERQAIPGSVLKHFGQPMLPVGRTDFAFDPAKVMAGRARFAQMNCTACHALTDSKGPLLATAAKPLQEVARRPNAGCLAEKVPAGAPKFDLTVEQRVALRRTLSNLGSLAQAASPAQQVSLTASRLGCLACHQRDGVGGPGATGRDGWFKVLGEADLGEEGKLPPHLEKVGGKLRREWLSKLLSEGSKVRPYMATRMPVFGTANTAHLPAAFEAADVSANAQVEPAHTERDAKFGRRLVGRDGLSCIACHTFSTHGSTGIPALGLDRMHERLRWDWFRRYLPDPAALRPGTRMPSFWPEGRAANTEILDGNTEAQIRSVWAWMAAGAQADIPAGLVRSRQELAASKEAVIYRNFIEGAGSRAIGVGYPEHANLAFDANQLRMAMIWQGAFIDTARHSTDRGTGFEPPLGDHVVKLPDGAPFAVLETPEAAWPKASGKAAGYQFLGYTLDDIRRPSFRYRFQGITIDDTPLPRAVDVDIVLTRTLRFSGNNPAGAVWFRAAEGSIQADANGGFTIDGKVRMRFPGAKPVIVGRELRVPVPVPGQLVQEILW